MNTINSANISTNSFTIQVPGSKNDGVVLKVTVPDVSSHSGIFEDKTDVSIPAETDILKSEASYLKDSTGPGILTRMADTMSKVGSSILIGLSLMSTLAVTTPAMADEVNTKPATTIEVVEQKSQLPPGFASTTNPTVVNDTNLPGNNPTAPADVHTEGLAVHNDRQKVKDQAVAQQVTEKKAEKQAQTPYGEKLVKTAVKFDGKNFRKGSFARCADFVSSVIEWTGAPKGFEHQFSAQGLAGYGTKVDKSNLKAGDLVYFKNTYKRGNYTHVGIYVGNGEFVHRPTSSKPVRTDSLNNVYWAGHYQTARRINL